MAGVTGIFGAVQYCRRQRRRLKRMDIGPIKKKDDRRGPKPPPWPPGKNGQLWGAQRQQRGGNRRRGGGPHNAGGEYSMLAMSEALAEDPREWGSSSDSESESESVRALSPRARTPPRRRPPGGPGEDSPVLERGHSLSATL